MKTLDEIINRHDYVRVNAALVKRADELGRIFAKKFYELTGWAWVKESEYPKYEIVVNGHKYCAKAWQYSFSGSDIRIHSVDFCRFYDETFFDEGDRVWRHHYRYFTAYQECLEFLNDAKDILAKLVEKEDELVKDAEEAIENAKDVKV